MIQGKTVEFSLLNGYHASLYDEARKQLAAQKPEELDLPLRVDIAFGFPTGQSSEFSIKFAIDPQGKVIDAEVVSANSEAGKDFILAPYTLSRWRFAPPMHASVPTGYCCVLVTIGY